MKGLILTRETRVECSRAMPESCTNVAALPRMLRQNDAGSPCKAAVWMVYNRENRCRLNRRQPLNNEVKQPQNNEKSNTKGIWLLTVSGVRMSSVGLSAKAAMVRSRPYRMIFRRGGSQKEERYKRTGKPGKRKNHTETQQRGGEEDRAKQKYGHKKRSRVTPHD